MNCIDAIEGTAKCILDRLQQISEQGRIDDTEHIRNVRAVIEAAGSFLEKNKEVSSKPELLERVLYTYSKDIWLLNLSKDMVCGDEIGKSDKSEYHEYYFDHIYEHNEYPK